MAITDNIYVLRGNCQYNLNCLIINAIDLALLKKELSRMILGADDFPPALEFTGVVADGIYDESQLNHMPGDC